MYLFPVNFDTLNAVWGIYSIYIYSVPDYRNFMIALPVYESLRAVKHLNFILNFLIHPQLLKCLKTMRNDRFIIAIFSYFDKNAHGS